MAPDFIYSIFFFVLQFLHMGVVKYAASIYVGDKFKTKTHAVEKVTEISPKYENCHRHCMLK